MPAAFKIPATYEFELYPSPRAAGNMTYLRLSL
jgi:hypothetical protein